MGAKKKKKMKDKYKKEEIKLKEEKYEKQKNTFCRKKCIDFNV